MPSDPARCASRDDPFAGTVPISRSEPGSSRPPWKVRVFRRSSPRPLGDPRSAKLLRRSRSRPRLQTTPREQDLSGHAGHSAASASANACTSFRLGAPPSRAWSSASTWCSAFCPARHPTHGFAANGCLDAVVSASLLSTRCGSACLPSGRTRGLGRGLRWGCACRSAALRRAGPSKSNAVDAHSPSPTRCRNALSITSRTSSPSLIMLARCSQPRGPRSRRALRHTREQRDDVVALPLRWFTLAAPSRRR